MQVIKKRFLRVVLKALLYFFIFLLILIGLIQFPYVQTRIVSWLSESFSESTGYTLFIDQVNIDWFDKVAIEGVGLYDPENNRLLNADRIEIDFAIRSLIDRSNRNIDEVNISGAEIFLTRINIQDSIQTLNINELVRRIKALIKKEKKTRKYVSVDMVTLDNATFIYDDPRKDSIQGFDYNHFRLNNINGSFRNLLSISDTLALDILQLSAIDEKTQLELHDMESFFRVSQQAMEFYDLSLKIGQSELNDSIRFLYNGTAEMSEFNTKVRMEAHLEDTRIYSKDLALFASVFKNYDDTYSISGVFQGLVNNFNFTDASVKFGRNTAVNGRIRMAGLPDFSETFIDFDLEDSYVRIADLRDYVKPATYQRLAPFSTVRFNSQFLGFPSDFVANGDFYTDFGNINSDINLKLEDDINQSRYTGRLSVSDFNLGGYTGEKLFGRVTMNGEVEGTGFTLESANFVLKGRIDEIGINNYNYVNIDTDARFAKEYFEGFLQIDDPNLKLTTTGSIDLREGIDLFNVRAQLDTARLDQLNITDEEFFLHSRLTIDATGLELDSIEGVARLSDTFVRYKQKSLQLDSLMLESNIYDDRRTIDLTTSLLNARLIGDFDITTLIRDVKNLYTEFRLNFENDPEELRSYYAAKSQNPDNHDIDYSIELVDGQPLFDVFLPEIFVSGKTNISGRYISGYTSIFSLLANPDTVSYKGNFFYNNDLQLNISKVSDSTNVLAMAFGSSERQMLENISTKSLFIEGIWNDDHIDFEFDIDQTAYPNYARLYGEVDFLDNLTRIRFAPSNLTILDKMWTIEPSNSIEIQKQRIEIHNLNISHEGQELAFDGVLSADPSDVFNIRIDSIQLDNINTIINQQLSGTINGFADIREYYGETKIQSSGTLQELTIDDFLIGNITGTNNWNHLQQHFETSLSIERSEDRILLVDGTYTPSEETEQLNLTANLNKTNLKILEPFFGSFFSNIQGTASGLVRVTGKLRSPYIRGEGIIEDGQAHVNYLNTDYLLEGSFFLEPDRIGFQRINLTDTRDQKAFLSGIIGHTNYKDFYMDLQGVMNQFTVLETRAQDNELFYGTGIATGEISFEGPVKNMSITARARTERGTRIFIPIGDTESFEQKDFIQFLDFNDTTNINAETLVERVDLRGLKLDFDLEVTPAAYAEIIFDIKAGDIIRGRGNGDIKLQIDTKGDFNMFGDFEIQEGGYNFTLYNIINKEFEILPNSKISWYGDPYQGILDINATYNQLATFLPLLIQQESDEVYSESVELRRKYPVQVLLDIEGPLLSPTVDFDIVAKELPRNITVAERNVDLEFEFLRFKNSIDEQELKRQVFSLIVLRKFSPLQSFNTGGAITSSVSELLSNQLSYWITQVDENLEIDVDLGALDNEAFNTFQLRLSYTFLDGRLRVTRAGGFTNQQNKVDISSIAGDWMVEYLLTPDGKFKAKMYNRTNYNPIYQTDDNRNTITTGFGFIYTQTFDDLKELFQRSRKKQPETPEENQVETDPLILSNRDDESE